MSLGWRWGFGAVPNIHEHGAAAGCRHSSSHLTTHLCTEVWKNLNKTSYGHCDLRNASSALSGEGTVCLKSRSSCCLLPKKTFLHIKSLCCNLIAQLFLSDTLHTFSSISLFFFFFLQVLNYSEHASYTKRAPANKTANKTPKVQGKDRPKPTGGNPVPAPGPLYIHLRELLRNHYLSNSALPVISGFLGIDLDLKSYFRNPQSLNIVLINTLMSSSPGFL